MPIFKFLHIASMFMGVAFSIGGHWFLERVAATQDLRAIRSVFAATKPMPILINGFLGAGLLFGLIAAYFDQFNFLAPWLIASYVLFILLSVLGGAVTGKWVGQVQDELGEKLKRCTFDRVRKIIERSDAAPRFLGECERDCCHHFLDGVQARRNLASLAPNLILTLRGNGRSPTAAAVLRYGDAFPHNVVVTGTRPKISSSRAHVIDGISVKSKHRKMLPKGRH